MVLIFSLPDEIILVDDPGVDRAGEYDTVCWSRRSRSPRGKLGVDAVLDIDGPFGVPLREGAGEPRKES